MNFDLKVISKKSIYLIISSVMVLASIIFLFATPLNLGIDFRGGELLQLKFSQPLDRDKLNSTLNSLENEVPALKNKRLQYSEDNTIVIRTEALKEEQKSSMQQSIRENVGEYEVVQNDKVAPTIGKELASNALKALIVGSILIIIYITIRFEFVYAIASIIALLHDILITVGLIALINYEVDTTFIAAVLTILGYSINDTIVIFDRIRENEKRDGNKKDFATIIEESVNQTVIRSIYTSITTLLGITMLLLFGGSSLKAFSMTLFIGMIIGTYSSIFLASPLVYLMRKWHKPNKKSKKSNNDYNNKRRSGKTVNGYDESDKVLV